LYDMPPELVVTAQGNLRIIELNNPDQHNATIAPLHRALGTVWRRIAQDEQVRAIILTARGPSFCAGGDFEAMRRTVTDDGFRDHILDEARAIVLEMVRCPLPIVTAINGPAVGLGASLAVMSDIVLMADDTYIQDPHVAVALAAGDGGPIAWPLSAGLLRAKYHLLLGRRVDAVNAVAFGLANEAVPSDELRARAVAIAERLASQPPQALRTTKQALNLHLERALERGLEFGLDAERASMATPEYAAIVARLTATETNQ
jgi:enoyl-CoA hydratase